MHGDPRFDVVGVGANSVDLVHLVPSFPRPEGWHSKMRVSRRIVSCGGQTATAMAACARFGLRALYVGAVGDDENGRRVRAELPREGLGQARLVSKPGRNQSALIILDQQTGERAVLWDRDDTVSLAASDLPFDAIAASRLLHVDDVSQEAAIAAARCARVAGIPVTSDLDRMTERTEELVLAVSHAIFADGLPEQLTGERDHERALRRLRRKHDALLVVTLGRDGAVALDGDRFLRSPGIAVTALDTTGSGDVFRAGFIFGLLQGWPTERTLRLANAAAALACTQLGAMPSIPSLDDALELAERRGCPPPR